MFLIKNESQGVCNILGCYSLATTSECNQGLSWYKSAKTVALDIAIKYAISVEDVAFVIAALSPSNRWERNLIDAENLIRLFVQGEDQDVLNLSVSTYPAMKEKALKILKAKTNTDKLKILKGPKITEFYNCINGDKKECCIDGHAYCIWLGQRLTLKDVPPISKKLREQIKADYRRATELINKDLELKYLVSDIQAITWVTWRRIYEV